jgi:signal transduction histidine kinase
VHDGSRRRAIRYAIILSLAVLTSVAHYFTDPSHFLFHNIYQRLYYVPILLAAAWFGVRGGALVAIICAGLYIPHILIHWAHSELYKANQLIELPMFLAIALIVGVVSDREREQRSKAEKTAGELDRALKDLEATVETLRRADRLATLGTLAAGMAHEIRNPLTSIVGVLEIIEPDFPEGHSHREFVGILRQEIGRLGTIATKYLDFARPPVPSPVAVDVNAAVKSSAELIQKSAERSSIRIETQLAEGLPRALADPVQLNQALLNVLLNGMQAMPEGGVLDVSTAATRSSVGITVRDHGAGLPAGPIERIFEPFFTTKQGGTGLGLAVTKQILTAHGGTIHADSAAGGGAVFELTLPIAPDGVS